MEKDVFLSRGLTELEVLGTNKCEIRTTEFGAFNGLTKPTFLSLSRNEIRKIAPRTFTVLLMTQTRTFTNIFLIFRNMYEHQYLQFTLRSVQQAMPSFSSLSYTTRKCYMFQICTSLTWL